MAMVIMNVVCKTDMLDVIVFYLNKCLQKNFLEMVCKSQISIKFCGVSFVNDLKTSAKKCKFSWKQIFSLSILIFV